MEIASYTAQVCTPMSLQSLYELWDRLRDIPTEEDGDSGIYCIDEGFLHFAIGTPCETIWHWFEEQHPDFIVGDVMQGIRK